MDEGFFDDVGFAGFSALIVVAPVTVETRVKGEENDSIHSYRVFTKKCDSLTTSSISL